MSNRLLLGAIADDFTGATDLCSTLVAEGMRAIQTVGLVDDLDLPPSDAVVVALKSRTAPPADAIRDALDALVWLQRRGAQQFFFKYCSTLDSTTVGNIGPVADALLSALEAKIAVVCPAFPENGRTVYQGHLFVGDRLLSESSMAHHPLTPMTDPDIVRFLGCQTPRLIAHIPYEVVSRGGVAIERRLHELRDSGISYAVVDAIEDAHLRAIGAACINLPLVTGSSGVARGLPRNFRIRGVPLTGNGRMALPVLGDRAVVLAASCSAATQEQVRRMAEYCPAVPVDVVELARTPGFIDDIAASALPRLADGPVLIYTTAPPDEVERVHRSIGVQRASSIIESAIGELARRFVAQGVQRVMVAGGETSAAVVQALGVRALAVGRDIAPGVPWMVSVHGPPLALVLKSGNFGGPDFFLDALGLRR